MNEKEKLDYKTYKNHQRQKHKKKAIKSQTGSGKTQNIRQFIEVFSM